MQSKRRRCSASQCGHLPLRGFESASHLHLVLSRTTMGSTHLPSPASSPAGWASVAASKGPSAAPATGRLHADVISCQLPLSEPERGSVSEPTAGLSEPTGRNGVFVAPVGDGPLFQDARGQQSAYSPIFGGIRAWPGAVHRAPIPAPFTSTVKGPRVTGANFKKCYYHHRGYCKCHGAY